MLCFSILVIEWVVWCGCGVKVLVSTMVLSACVICIVLSRFLAFMKRGVKMGGVSEWVMIMNMISLCWRDLVIALPHLMSPMLMSSIHTLQASIAVAETFLSRYIHIAHSYPS